MGVFYLLGYVFGSILVTLGGRNLLLNLRDGEPLVGALQMLAFGVAVILASAVLQALVVKRRGNAGVLDRARDIDNRFLLLAGVAWLLPTVAAWAQFESFREPIYMFPVLTIGGAIALVLGAASRFTSGWALRAPAMTCAIALVGLPVGLITVGWPMSHFRHHLSDVVVFTVDENNRTEHRFEADEPFFDEYADVGLGDETHGLLGAIARAEAVVIDVDEEIAAGRMKRLDDGSYVTANADGTFPTLSASEQLTKMLGAAIEADGVERAAKRAERRRAWEDERDRRRSGGRIFSR